MPALPGAGAANTGAPRHSLTTPAPTTGDIYVAHTSTMTTVPESLSGRCREHTSNKCGRKRFQREFLRLPNQFMARVLINLIYMVEVTTTDVVEDLVFCRWRGRFCHRAKNNRKTH